ncbi:MAG: hypothetical protein ABIT58_08395 [Ferruginibacter sp.]
MITDCSKQLTTHSKLREKNDNYIKIYEVGLVESDQYRLQLITKNDLPPEEEVGIILTCKQIIDYHFEVETGR